MTERMIPFEKLSNFRDLGGLPTGDGRRIRSGKLFRGGNLNEASEADIAKLSGMMEMIVDFRTEREVREKPDPVIPGAELWHLPLMETITEGVTREKKADENAFTRYMEDREGSLNYMIRTYEHLASSRFALDQLKKLLQYLTIPKEKGVLWHCAAGKDRTGIFAMIVEEILGVPRDVIIDDYLLTNEGNREVVDRLVKFLISKSDADPEKAVPALETMFGAQEEYILAYYGEAEKQYGSFERFLEDALGVDPEMRETFRRLYLL